MSIMEFFGFKKKEAAKSPQVRVSPERIEELSEGQIFVFGSDELGWHNGGAARLALGRFGAIFGQAKGLQGQSYAIPTNGVQLSGIAQYVDEFIGFARKHPELTFLVTRIGCGVAGYTEKDIAPLFASAYRLPNVYLPASFRQIIGYRFN